MVYNNELKREIPEGWIDGVLSDIADITMGQSPPGESYNENGKGIIFYQGRTDFGWRFPSNRLFTTAPTRFADEGDILLSVRAPVGDLNIANENCCIGRGLAALKSLKSQQYLFGVLSNLKQVFDRRNVDGTTFGAITKDDLFSQKVVIPKESVLDEFEKIVSSSDKIILNNHKQNHHLITLRDWLLPMLMNGQVRVGEAGKKEYQPNEAEMDLAAEPGD
jgi:type I restriction enzyme S subunit